MSAEVFAQGLEALGYKVTRMGGNRVSFPWTVPIGRMKGTEVTLGFEVGQAFPDNPPGGPHIRPRLLPINKAAGKHPFDAVHESPFGGDWEYWSRPFPDWPGTDRTVRDYMGWIHKLFATL